MGERGAAGFRAFARTGEGAGFGAAVGPPPGSLSRPLSTASRMECFAPFCLVGRGWPPCGGQAGHTWLVGALARGADAGRAARAPAGPAGGSLARAGAALGAADVDKAATCA